MKKQKRVDKTFREALKPKCILCGRLVDFKIKKDGSISYINCDCNIKKG